METNSTHIDKIKAGFNKFLETKIASLETKFKVIILAAALIVPVVAFIFLFYSPKNDEIRILERKKISLEKEISGARARANQLDKHKAEVRETELVFQQASVLLPQQKEIPSLLTNISSLGTVAGLDFVTFQPNGEHPMEFYAEIPISISVRGPYHNVGNFLYQVSKMDRIVSVSNINLGSPARTKGEMLLNANFTLVTYRFIESSVDDKKEKKVNGKSKRKK